MKQQDFHSILLGSGLALFCGVTVALAAPGLEAPLAGPGVIKAASMPSSVSVGASLDDVRVYPNPWRADKHAGKSITFDHLPSAATVKLFTVSGQFIKTLDVDDAGTATWDPQSSATPKIASGLYFYVASTEDGQDIKGKLAIIK